MTVFVFDNIIELMNKFDEYKSETLSKWRKTETRGPLFLHPGSETLECIQHSTLRGANNIRFLNWAPLRTVKDHTPYVSIGRHIYACYFGTDPSRPRKLRTLEKEMQNLTEDERKLVLEEKMSSWGMDHVACPAKVRIMYVIKFPTLKTHIHEKRRQMTHLFDDLMRTNPSNLVMKHTYILELPIESSHSDHPYPDLNITSMNKRGDRAVNEAIEWYTQQTGVSNVIITTDQSDDSISTDKEEFPLATSTPEIRTASIESIAEQIMNGATSMVAQNSSVGLGVNVPSMSDIAGPSILNTSTSSILDRHTSSTSSILDRNTRKRKISDQDPDNFFLLSLSPQMKMLSPRKISEVKIEFLKVLHKAQFESD